VEFKIEEKQDLKSFISEKMSLSRSKAKELIDKRQVFVNDRRVWIASHVLNPGDKLSVDTGASGSKNGAIRILYEDENILAADKPAGIVTDAKRARLRRF